jgi:hypothetical protein
LRVNGTVLFRVGPGVPARLLVTVGNPLAEAVVLTAAQARVTSTSASSCRTEWYRVGPFSGTRTVEPRGETTLELPVTFVNEGDVNQDACKGARYSFTVDVRGRQA